MAEKPVIYAWIFARGGSKGLPGKNVRPLLGKPLIAYAIETAKQSRYIQDVFVSTDNQEIADIARQYGAKVPFLRPDELSGDKASERMAWQHAVQWLRNQSEYPAMDIMVSLPAPTPLRTVEEVDQAMELYLEGKSDTVIAVSPSARHPAFDMVYVDKDKYCNIILRKYEEWVPNRQSYPTAYNISGSVYVSSADYIMSSDSYFKGRVQAIEVPPEHGIDIDTLFDFKLAEFFLKERKSSES